jgi:hypothetical protein
MDLTMWFMKLFDKDGGYFNCLHSKFQLLTYEKVKRVLAGTQNAKLAFEGMFEGTVRQGESKSMGLLRRCYSNYSKQNSGITKCSLKHVR